MRRCSSLISSSAAASSRPSSLFSRCSSGVGAVSGIGRSASSSPTSGWVCGCACRWRAKSTHRLAVIRNSQVEKPLSPRKSSIERHARRNTSCVMSAASSGEPEDRNATAYTRFSFRRTSSSKAARSPRRARARICFSSTAPASFPYVVSLYPPTACLSSSASAYSCSIRSSAQMRVLNDLSPRSYFK